MAKVFKVGDIVKYTTQNKCAVNPTRTGKIIDIHDNGDRGVTYLVEYERKDGKDTFNSRQWIYPREWIPADTLGIYTSQAHWSNGWKIVKVK